VSHATRSADAASQVERRVGRSRYAEESRRKPCDWIHDLRLAFFDAGRVFINRCEAPEERCLQFDKAACLESGHNRCVSAKNGCRLPQRHRLTPWWSTFSSAESCIRYIPQKDIFCVLARHLTDRARPTNGSDRGFASLARSNLIRWASEPAQSQPPKNGVWSPDSAPGLVILQVNQLVMSPWHTKCYGKYPIRAKGGRVRICS
jgi:hypothetical protein